MGRKSIGQLKSPPLDRDVTQSAEPLLSGFMFETKAQAKVEDRKRRKALKRLASRPKSKRSGLKKRDLLSVARNIRDKGAASSSRYMREHRHRIINAVYELAGGSGEDLIFITLIPFGFRYSGGKLRNAEAAKLLERIRQVLLRYGAGDRKGWLIGFLDGEFEPESKVFVLHFHALATKNYAEVLSRARKGKLFRSQREACDQRVRSPIRINKNLTNLPRLTGYLAKSFWPERFRTVTPTGSSIHERRKRRIGEPFHSEYLLWLDRYQIQDLCLTLGLSVSQDGSLSTTI